MDVNELVDEYLTQSSWKVKENSNKGYSFSGLYKHVAGETVEEYVLNKIYSDEIEKAHKSGDFHIHDLSFGLCGYCAGWSLQDLLREGFGGVAGRVSSNPANHYDSALLQMSNFLGTLQNEWAGAQAFNSMDTLLAPFVREDDLSYRDVKQGMQKFVYNMNITSRYGGQTPFTNLTMDWTVPEDLKDDPAIIGGEEKGEKYSDYQKEMDMINKAFLEVLSEGDANGRPFTFPIPTYNITEDFPWDNHNGDLLFKVTAKYGLPYFSNFLGQTDLDTSDIRSMCCRLRLDQRELERNVTGGLFGSSDKTGSLGVVTLNIPRLAYLSEDKNEFFELIEEYMEMAKESLETKREMVQRNMENGLVPYSKRYLGTLKNHFSTIGLVGFNEGCYYLNGTSLISNEGKELAMETLEFMRKKLSDFQEETGNLYNLEASPAEGTSYRLARKDRKQYSEMFDNIPKVMQNMRGSNPYYTNSTQLPVYETGDIFEAVEHQEDIQSLYTGGTVFHAFMGEKMNAKGAKTFVEKILENSKIPYLTVTPTYSICPQCGYITGEHYECPDCGKRCEVYSRVVGYMRPVQDWNDGKQKEFEQRKMFD